SHDYDLIHQKIEVSNFDWDSTSFRGVTTTTIVARRPALDSIVLDEGALLRNTRVTGAGRRALRTARHGDTLVVFPERPAGFGDTVTFTVAYDGKIDNGHGLTFITPDGLAHRPRQLWSQGEDMDNHFWFPTYDFPNDKESWELVATVDTGDVAVSNGTLASDVRHGATHTMTWREDRPSATYLVSLVVGPFAKIHDSWKGVPVDYYVYHADSALAWRLFHPTVDMIDTYSRLTGVKYPWAKYAQTTVADFFGGMENVSATTLVDWLPDARAYQDRPWYEWLLIPHELAHQWFGDYVTTEDWANLWLNEGFAEFMPGQYWGEKLGEHAAEDYYLDEYHQYVATDARAPMALASYHSNNIYPKGALVLQMLQDYLGPTRFWASLHTYLTRHAFGNGTTDDLRQAVLATTGENLDWFWSEWVYGAGYPKFTVTAAYDTAARTLTLHVAQTQQDTLKPDRNGVRFQVDTAFRMPVTIRVGTADGDVVQHAWLDARDQTIAVSGVRTAPTMVVFDDGNHIVKGLTFDQPTAWLVTQLAKDPNLWNREWAIGQLARRTDEPAAAAALGAAADRADYFLTRRQAVEALGAFPPASAMAAVTAALRDTASAVRSAAVTALGRLGGTDAVTRLREAFAHDPSYDVRAAAVSALVQADTAHADGVLARALMTPSYREVIRHAALEGVARLQDTARTKDVEGLIALDAEPAQVLGVLATRGDSTALQALLRHIDDDRSGVRRYVVGGFALALRGPGRAEILGRLRQAAPLIMHADTKQQVQGLITEAEKGAGG
ncbi:MAG: HEAT repeat domain-containing protein, partial [Gemmatimonadota bacterium]|nr:HEAT repeat domain-containing protein [Gemmatimonadota bacterium]